MSKQKCGFTLIELLVVIAIIAILAAILFPVFAQAREKARSISCLSNAKQLGSAIVMYLQDYDEAFPPYVEYPCEPAHQWPALLQPYIKNEGVYKCPSAIPVVGALSYRCAGYGVNYRHMMRCFQPPNLGLSGPCRTPRFLASVGRPAETMVVADGMAPTDEPTCVTPNQGWPALYCTVCYPDGVCINPLGKSNALAKRHQGGGNYVFADGHAKWYRPEQIRAKKLRGEDMWGHFDDPSRPT